MGDDVSCTYASSTASFADEKVGTGKTVTVTGLTLTGAQASNYALASPVTTTANITAVTLTANVTVPSKAYDRNASATVTGCTLGGTLMGDDVSCTYAGSTGSFADEKVGTGKTVTVTGLTLTGAQASNYALATPVTTTANI